jgi:hypothetical protein
MDKKLLLALLSVFLALPVLASAAPTLISMANSLAMNIIGVGYAVVVIGWIITGVLFLTAAGDPAKISTGKMALFASIAGTIIVILAQTAVSFVGSIFGT